jgi:hypothetical protein
MNPSDMSRIWGEVVGDVTWIESGHGPPIACRVVRLANGSRCSVFAYAQDAETILAWKPGDRVRVGWDIGAPVIY